ncbi:cell division protein FtsL [Aerococcus sanguinicola]|uniref:Cell division protein FtsL n=1 Tax=Aerococcus sanguinicola TaxID=119206 RepID=A0A109RCY6_9LACT|nr:MULTISPECIES: cell division protein FtsL [Aerococcus]AMB93505.1 hypothetical protein AWM72_01465 [Aerococcus sanguinicola]MDK7050721.1 cell division protein FtsL [Aerococcus sanguinicola]OFT97640.1 hypothetical protein HMPREF3090_00600 [Aerococcus sp. HMSC23C02]PKZ21766.1 cell division protein FtsL [Aerococcus sanguinicola]
MGLFALHPEQASLAYAMPAEKAAPLEDQPSSPKKSQVHLVQKPAHKVHSQKRFLTTADWIKLISMFMVTAACLIFLVASKAQYMQADQELKGIQAQISDVQNNKNNIQQKVNELGNYDRVMEVAKDQGLTMDEDNIRNVEE